MAKGHVYTSKSGKQFDDRRGSASGSDQSYPIYEGYYLRPHDMNSLKEAEVQELIRRTIREGRVLSDSEVLGITGKHGGGSVYDTNKIAYYHAILDDNADKFGFDSTGVAYTIDTGNAQQSAYDAYYRDLYSLDDGTLGKTMLDNLAEAERNAAVSNMQLAEAQYQQQAMQQAETVKAITDQVRTERMARLRAGMSEAQIANQDMQTMLTNMNALNQQAAEMNANKLAAQQQYNLAQDTAYQQYIQNATAVGGTSAAFAASDAGSAHSAALNYMRMTGEKDYNTALKKVQGGNS